MGALYESVDLIQAGPEGGARIVVTQSQLKSFLACPEQFRQVNFQGVVSPDSDASLIGSGAHLVVEEIIGGSETVPAREKGAELIEAHWDLVDKKDVKKLSTAVSHMNGAVDYWVRDIAPMVTGVLDVELTFEVPWFTMYPKGEPMEVWMRGTIDCPTDNGIWDWKTANPRTMGDRYEPWKLKRWDIQSVMYTHAYRYLYEIHRDAVVPFRWGVMPRGKVKNGTKCLTPEVERNWTHTAWVQEQAKHLVRSLMDWDSDDVWLMNDQQVLCSTKWCPVAAAGRCKGAIRGDF